MKIRGLKLSSIPKMAVIATGVVVAIMVATVGSVPVATAFPSYLSDCAECHGPVPGVVSGTVTAVPNTATPAASAAYTVLVTPPAGVGRTGYWIANSNEAGDTLTSTGVRSGPSAAATYTANMTAPATDGVYYYKVWSVTGGEAAAGLANFALYSITVGAVAAAPTASFTADVISGVAPLTVVFADTSIGSPTSWAWAFGGGMTSILRNDTATYNTPGVYTVTLTATNGTGSDVSVPTTITVTAAPTTPPPVAALSVNLFPGTTAKASLNVAPAFDMSETSVDPGETIVSGSLNYGDGTPAEALIGVDPGLWDPTHPYTTVGVKTVTLTVTDSAGATDTATVTVTVYVLPSVTITATGPTSPGVPVAFNVAPFTPVGTVLEKYEVSYDGGVSWDYSDADDGPPPATLSHTFATAGMYTVMVAVYNDADGSAIGSTLVSVGVPVPVPTASFTASATSGVAPLTVALTDTSTNAPTGWAWDFGDGGVVTDSTSQNASVTYPVGTYTVTLIATNAAGASAPVTRTITVTAPKPTAGFNASALSGDAPLTVALTDTSTNAPTGWAWDFGDGGVVTDSTSQNASVTYPVGTYTVTLIATNAAGASAPATRLITVTANATAPKVTGLTATAESSTSITLTWTNPSPLGDLAGVMIRRSQPGGSAPTAHNVGILVKDVAAGVTTWTDTGLLPNTQYTYAAFAYDQGLKYGVASTRSGTTLAAAIAPTADFTSAVSGTSPLTVALTDTSTGAPTSWAWTFGNGTTSTVQSPSVTYTDAGAYPVTLIASNAGGASVAVTKTVTVVAPLSKPTARFTPSVTTGVAPLVVTMTNTSTGATTSTWNFGNGTTTTVASPSVTYTAAGTYQVTLKAENAAGDDTATATITVTAGVTPSPVASVTRLNDFNGDRHTDLVARDTVGKMWLYPGTGTGGFVPRKLIGTGWHIYSAIVSPGDVTGDGDADILARDAAGQLYLYEGNGASGVANRRVIGAKWNVMTTITGAGDMFGDSSNDILARDTSGNLWLYPMANGAFQARRLIGTGWNVMTAITGPGDFSGDSEGDILARDNVGRLWLYRGTGLGTVRPRTQVATNWGAMSALVTPGNWDKAVGNDLIARDGAGTLWNYPGNGAGGFNSTRVKLGTGWNGYMIG